MKAVCGCLDPVCQMLVHRKIAAEFSLVLLPGHGFPLHVPCSLACLSNALVGSLYLEQTVQRLAVPRGRSGSDRGQPCFPLIHISHCWLHSLVRCLCVCECALILSGLLKPLALQDLWCASWWSRDLVFSCPLASFSTFLHSSPVLHRFPSSWCHDVINLNSSAPFPHTFLSIVQQ